MDPLILEHDIHALPVVRFFLLKHFFPLLFFFLSDFLSLLKQSLFSFFTRLCFGLLLGLFLRLLCFFAGLNCYNLLFLLNDLGLFFYCLYWWQISKFLSILSSERLQIFRFANFWFQFFICLPLKLLHFFFRFFILCPYLFLPGSLLSSLSLFFLSFYGFILYFWLF